MDEMNGLERVATALQFKEADRVPVAPLVCGATHRVAGITYGEWSSGNDVDAMVRGHLDALKLLGHDGIVALVDLSVEAADFGQEVFFPEMNTAYPNYDNPFIKTIEDYKKIQRINPRKTKRMKSVIDLICRYFQTDRQHPRDRRLCVRFARRHEHDERRRRHFFMDLIEHPDEVLAALQAMDETLARVRDGPGRGRCPLDLL